MHVGVTLVHNIEISFSLSVFQKRIEKMQAEVVKREKLPLSRFIQEDVIAGLKKTSFVLIETRNFAKIISFNGEIVLVLYFH